MNCVIEMQEDVEESEDYGDEEDRKRLNFVQYSIYVGVSFTE